jgi:DNA-binding IclR family transcriptional regulator
MEAPRLCARFFLPLSSGSRGTLPACKGARQHQNPSVPRKIGRSRKKFLDNETPSHNMATVSRAAKDVSPYRVQVLDRALAALDALAERPESSLVELCSALRLHKSTVHRLLMVLEQHRLVDKSPETGRYRLGLKLFELGSKAIAALDLRERSQPYLTRLQRETQETVNIAILDQGEVLYVAKIEPQKNLRMSARVGHRYPSYSTALGKAILAALPEAEVETIIRRSSLKARTPKTITTAAALKTELREVRACGYAIDDEENEEGARCVGAAVWDHMGRPVASISVSAPAVRMDEAKMEAAAAAVLRAASDLSRELGYGGAPEQLAAAAGKGR